MSNKLAADEVYSITLEGPGLTLSREITIERALKVLAVVMGDSSISQRAASALSVADFPGSDVEISIGDFFNKIGAKNNRERIAAILLYLSEYHKKNLIPKDEIPEWFQRAHEPAPRNISRDIGEAVSENLISEDVEKPDHYFITNTGRKRLSAKDSA